MSYRGCKSKGASSYTASKEQAANGSSSKSNAAMTKKLEYLKVCLQSKFGNPDFLYNLRDMCVFSPSKK